MLRTLALTLAIGLPGVAAAEQFPEAAVAAEVRSHEDGAAMGRVAAVERDADGRVIAAEIPGLEPADAPYASSDLVAEAPRAVARDAAEARATTAGGGGARERLR